MDAGLASGRSRTRALLRTSRLRSVFRALAALALAAPVLIALQTPASANVSFGPRSEFVTGSGPVSVTSAYIDPGQNIDLVTANANSNSVSVLLGDGAGGFGPRTDLATGSSPVSVVRSDFNKDAASDLAVANEGSNTVSVFLGNGIGGFGPRTDFATGSFPVSVAAADFDGWGFGYPDLAVANTGSNTVSVLFADGMGGFGPKSDWPTGDQPNSVVSADFNRDGAQDLAVANYGSN